MHTTLLGYACFLLRQCQHHNHSVVFGKSTFVYRRKEGGFRPTYHHHHSPKQCCPCAIRYQTLGRLSARYVFIVLLTHIRHVIPIYYYLSSGVFTQCLRDVKVKTANNQYWNNIALKSASCSNLSLTIISHTIL